MTGNQPGSDEQPLIGVKSEFEAEGLTQLEVADYFVRNPWANLRVVKIGGCEAKTDFRAALRLGANVIVAPMIESSFAVQKFAAMYPDSSSVKRWINLETISGLRQVREIFKSAVNLGVSGVVIGRGDLAESMGLPRNRVESRQVQDAVMQIAEEARRQSLHVGVGGMISDESTNNINELSAGALIDHFETRKVLISPRATSNEERIKEALKVEHDWITASINNLEAMQSDLAARAKRLEKSIQA